MQTEVYTREKFLTFRDELLRRQNKTDLVSSTSYAEMQPDGTVTIDYGDVHILATPTEWASQQIAAHTKIPVIYYRRMRDDATPLLATNVNHWFRAEPANRLFRVFEGELMAFLSDKYNRIDNYVVAQLVMEGAERIANSMGHKLQMHRSYLTDTTMNLTLWDPDMAIGLPNEPNDLHFPAINVKNSEVGAHAFEVNTMVIRGVCSNGLIYGGNNIRKIHVGKRLEGGIWSNETTKINDELIKSMTNDLTRAAFNRENIIIELAKVQKLKEIKLPPTLKDQAADELKLTEQESDDIWKRMEANNAYEFLQAVTNKANDYFNTNSNPERGTELQELGGRILADRTIWDRIERNAEKTHNKDADSD